MTIQLPGGEHWYDLQWSSAVYKNYIFIFGGSGVAGKIYWIDINDLPGFCGSPCSEGSNNVPCTWTSKKCMNPPYTFGETSQKIPKRWRQKNCNYPTETGQKEGVIYAIFFPSTQMFMYFHKK